MELLLHPVRIRIVHAFSGGRTRTTSELCARLPKIPQASIYRHVRLLVSGGVLQVVEQRPVRGAVERRYRLNQKRARIDEDAAARMSLDDHRRAFTSAMAALIADFNAYLDHGNADPTTDRVAYRQMTVWLTDEERTTLIRQIQQHLAVAIRNEPGAGRRQYLLSPILFPIAESLADGAAASRKRKPR